MGNGTRLIASRIQSIIFYSINSSSFFTLKKKNPYISVSNIPLQPLSHTRVRINININMPPSIPRAWRGGGVRDVSNYDRVCRVAHRISRFWDGRPPLVCCMAIINRTGYRELHAAQHTWSLCQRKCQRRRKNEGSINTEQHSQRQQYKYDEWSCVYNEQ